MCYSSDGLFLIILLSRLSLKANLIDTLIIFSAMTIACKFGMKPYRCTGEICTVHHNYIYTCDPVNDYSSFY